MPTALNKPRDSGLLISLALTLLPSAAVGSVALEEVVVTAQRKAESLQDAPISIAAFSSDALEKKGISNLVDLRANVPNLQLTPHPNSATTARVYMRGVGNNDDQVTQDPSVAVYMDGVYLARNLGLAQEVADIERIEVLRGPQGTLYGRNATGGAINVITKAPSPEALEFTQKFSAGNFDYFRSKSSLNLPLSDRLAAKLAYMTMQKEGFVDNAGTGVERFGDREREAWRVDVLWDATDAVEVRYAYDTSRIEDTPMFVERVPLHPEQPDRPERGSESVEGLKANDVTPKGHSLTVK
ncbi:outer membrane receptor protein involved in Fe transport [Litorivivens lipolytica]|uniref:Outer membrane receptor protein involved in Fe transport n=1 Tax=Litorivivens lipolytica TaxID=1524264 RepID=A0A7W4W718_9GAMM|nr:TonB-dependent receptor [Litorivivens lipolytica]MBB3048651.1 outer membrane receptor protein involved in Fe transport [Litorivivens lipolytica]